MEKDKPIETSTPEQILPDIATKQSHVTVIVFISVLAIFILVVTFFLTFIHSSDPTNTVKEQAKVQSITQRPLITIIPTGEVTTETKIAQSLDLPPLYPNIQWEDVTQASHAAEMNILWYSPGTKMIRFKGHYWKSTISSSQNKDLGAYYYDALQKNGWFEQKGIYALKFKDFTLYPQSEGGPCGGGDSFAGYKNGFIRIVTFYEQVNPCNPPSLTSTPTVISRTDYTIFLSDPMPLKEITSQIK